MDLQYQNCYFNGPLGVKALQFVCKDVAGGSVPTTTTTATFGSSSMPIATGAVPTPNPGASQPASPSSNGAVTTPNPSSSSQASDGSSAGSGSGLSHNTQIALGVGVPIAALLVAFLAWQFPKNIRHREAEGHAMVRPPLANSPANSPYNPPYHSTMNLHFNTNQTQPDNRNYGLHQQAYSPGNGRW
ncbi:MAG: hypothetical protein L6R39_000364 [Caloplaca ligustica]|nr:MAG: hypothetical protein L6R39_000364 [Caloplaca ligustica]